jgi:hypothetical protein
MNLTNAPGLKRSRMYVILLVGYVFMAMLVIQQGKTIDYQTQLIHSLFSDSQQLTQMKMDAISSKAHR